MTMSLSVARPMVAEPAGFCSDPDRDGSRAWNIFVARLPTSGCLEVVRDTSVCGAAGPAATDPTDPTAGICGGGKLGGAGGAPPGNPGGRPPPPPGYAGGGGDWPGCGRRNGGAARFGGRP